MQCCDLTVTISQCFPTKVTERCDISAEEMIKDLKTFSHDTKDAELAILIIMSHGDANGDIVCHENSVCKVHHILEAFSEEKENSRVSSANLFCIHEIRRNMAFIGHT